MSENGGEGLSVLGGAVRLGELFPGEWMDEHTEYREIETFLRESEGEPALTRGGDRTAPSDDHVASTTTFDDWGEMLDSALDDYCGRESSSLTE